MNLEFFNPYLKRIESMCHYRLIFNQFETEVQKNRERKVLRIIKKEEGKPGVEISKDMFVLDDFFEMLSEYIKELKINIFSKDED